MRAAVTGIAGFIGSHLAHDLVADHEVIGFDNCRSGDWSRVPLSAQTQDLDITAPSVDQWSNLLAGTQVLFHLAAEKYNSSRSTPQRVIDTNISATARMLQGAARAGVRQVVFTSSLYAYGSLGPDPMREDQPLTPNTYYGMSKAAGEDLLRVVARDHGLKGACARLFFVYGPRQYAEGGYKSVILTNFERMLDGQPPVVNGTGGQRLDYVHIDDVVAALRQLGQPASAGMMVNIGSGRAPTINELTALMQDIAGSHVQPDHGPADWTDGTIRCADTRRAREDLGWEATIPLDQGLGTVWDWLRER